MGRSPGTACSTVESGCVAQKRPPRRFGQLLCTRALRPDGEHRPGIRHALSFVTSIVNPPTLMPIDLTVVECLFRPIACRTYVCTVRYGSVEGGPPPSPTARSSALQPVGMGMLPSLHDHNIINHTSEYISYDERPWKGPVPPVAWDASPVVGGDGKVARDGVLNCGKRLCRPKAPAAPLRTAALYSRTPSRWRASAGYPPRALVCDINRESK